MGASVMDYLLGLLSGVTDNEALARLLIVGAIGMSTVIAVITVTLLVLGLQSPLQRRLALIKRDHSSAAPGREAPETFSFYWSGLVGALPRLRMDRCQLLEPC